MYFRSAFGSWILMNILLVTVPRYGAYTMMLTGALMVSTNALYYLNTPSRPLVIRIEDAILSFSYGWCFWLVLAAGKKQSITHSALVAYSSTTTVDGSPD